MRTKSKQKPITYADVGVDVDIEAQAAKILFKWSKKTWANRKGKLGEVVMPFDDFAGIRYINVERLPKDTVFYGGSDGVSTKAEIAERAERFDTLAIDLFAMVVDDAVIRGGEPVSVKTDLRISSLGKDTSRLKYVDELGSGYLPAAKMAEVAVINGEIAQETDRIGKKDEFRVGWSADVTWFAHKSRLLTGFEIKPGDKLVALEEKGMRCNGLSLIRKILAREYGSDWQKFSIGKDKLIDLALKPSVIYSSTLVDMFGGWNLDRKPKAKLHGAAHISGGGIPEKLARTLRPSGFGAYINNPFAPNKLSLHCQELGNVDDWQAYKTWNMGQGMICVTPNPEDVMSVAESHGIKAKVIGYVTKEPGIRIKSRGAINSGQTLEYTVIK